MLRGLIDGDDIEINKQSDKNYKTMAISAAIRELIYQDTSRQHMLQELRSIADFQKFF